MAGRFSVEAVFKAVDRITAPVTRMQDRIGRFTRTMDRGLRRVNRTLDKTVSKVKRGVKTASVAAAGLGAIFTNITGAGAEFGRAIGAAAAKFPDGIARGSEEFRALEDTAKEVGRTTEFTSVQAAKGLNFLAKAGFNARFSMKALADIVDFATASEMEFATAADIASDALGAFGLDSDDASQKMVNLRRVMDVMSATANKTNTSVEQLFETVKDGAPISTQAGVSIETFSATMGFLAQSGIKATKAGTAAKNITLALAGVGNRAADVFKRRDINIKLVDVNTGKLRDQLDVLDDLREVLAGFGEGQRVAIIESIFGKIPIAAAASLLGETGHRVRELRTQLQGVAGDTKRIAGFIRDDVKGSMDGFRSAVEGIKIAIFSLNEGPLKEAIDLSTKWVRANQEMIATEVGEFFLMIVKNIKPIAEWISRIGKALIVFAAFSVTLKTLIGILTLVNLIMAANPIVLIVLAVTAAIAAVSALVVWWDELVESFRGMPLAVQAVLAPITLFIEAVEAIRNAWGPLKDFFVNLWADILDVFDRSVGRIKNAVKTASDFLTKPGKKFIEVTQPFRDAMDAADARIARFFGFGGSEAQDGVSPSATPVVLSPQERISRNIEETNTSNISEVTIRDETGRAEVTGGSLGPGLKLMNSGAF